jgi:hypothetical protein
MLVVDPMKRMTIPEIRQHPWFQAHLPRYLAVPPPDTMQQAKKVCRLSLSLSLSLSLLHVLISVITTNGFVFNQKPAKWHSLCVDWEIACLLIHLWL